MATGSSGASEIENENTLHAKLQLKLARMLETEYVQELKHVLNTAKILAPRQLEKCGTFYDVWRRLERAGRLNVNEYDVLRKWLVDLDRIDCVREIDAYKKKIDDFRTEPKGFEQQLEKLTIDGAGDPQHSSRHLDAPIGESTVAAVQKTTASVKTEVAHSETRSQCQITQTAQQRGSEVPTTAASAKKECPRQNPSRHRKTPIGKPRSDAVPKTTTGRVEMEYSRQQSSQKPKPKRLSKGGSEHKTTVAAKSEIEGESLVNAARNGDTAEVLKLLSKGADVDYVDYKKQKIGKTALVIASQKGHLDIVNTLLKGGAKVDKEDKKGRTALMVASSKGHLDVIDTLLKGGAAIDKENKDGWTALLAASQNGHHDVVEALLKGGAEVNKEYIMEGCTALIYASQNGHLDVVNVLLKEGAEVNKQNKYGYTAVMTASQCGHLDVVDALLKKGAAIDKTSKDGHWTPLKLAEYGKHTEVVEFLKKSGAKR